jgi:hypothetical protein
MTDCAICGSEIGVCKDKIPLCDKCKEGFRKDYTEKEEARREG